MWPAGVAGCAVSMSLLVCCEVSEPCVGQEALSVLCPLGVQVTARDGAWAAAQRMQAFLAVARGSCEPPVFLELQYRAAGSRPPVLLAGKGVTFDR